MKSSRKIVINPIGIVVFLGFAAYSLMCLSASAFKMCTEFNASYPNILPKWILTKIIVTFSSKWNEILGIADLSKENIFVLHSFYLLASLIHSYLGIRALLQPSFAVGSNGYKVYFYYFFNYYYNYKCLFLG